MSWISAIRGRFTSNRRWILSALGVVLVSLGAFALWEFGWRSTPDGRGVVTQWNDTIANLGIEPVFPPEEDIYVGDLFAVISADKRPGKGPRDQPLLNRAVKIEHIDMLAELMETYNELPIFPDTDKPPKAIQDPWLQKANPNGVFATHGPRGLLTIAAFPGFTIRHERVASGGLTGLGFGLFGSSQQDSDTVELKIPFAETYGVPSALAAGKLTYFCSNPFTKDICKDKTLRNYLSYVAPGVLYKEIDPESGRPRYLVDVEIALVNRVYLTRSIEQTIQLGRNGAAIMQAVREAASHVKAAPSPQKPDPQTPPDAGSAAEQRTLDIFDRLGADLPGGLVSVIANSDSEYGLKQTFQRPIVIGYRAVRTSFDDELDKSPEARQELSQDNAASDMAKYCAEKENVDDTKCVDPIKYCKTKGHENEPKCVVFVGSQSQFYSRSGTVAGSHRNGLSPNSRYIVFLHDPGGSQDTTSRLVTALKEKGYPVRSGDHDLDVEGGPGVVYFYEQDKSAAVNVAELVNSVVSKRLQPRFQTGKNLPGSLGVWLPKN